MTRMLVLFSSTDFQPYELDPKSFSLNTNPDSSYVITKTIADGPFSTISKAKLKDGDHIVVIKERNKIQSNKISTKSEFRELSILKSLNHENIIKLIELIIDYNSGKLSLVLEYCSYPLAKFINLYPDEQLPKPQVKCVAKQLLKGLRYLHNNYIIYRDLEVSSLMINGAGILKIIDLSSCRRYTSENDFMSLGSGNKAYLSPEVLFGAPNYGTSADIWSAGCIIVELHSRKPMFEGSSLEEVVNQMIDLIGSPTLNSWPKLKDCDLFKSRTKFKKQDVYNLSDVYHETIDHHLLPELARVFVYNPEERMTARELLNSDWLQTAPYPAESLEIFAELFEEAI